MGSPGAVSPRRADEDVEGAPSRAPPGPCDNRPMQPAPRRRSPVVGATALAILLAGCGAISPTPSPSPSPSPTTAPTAASAAPTASATQDRAAVYASIEEQVTQLRQLERRREVAPKAMDSAALRAHVEAEFESENPADRVAADDRLAKTIGLIPAASSLADLYRDLLTSQVVGLYSPDDQELFVLDSGGALGPSARMVFAHEFTHALQDQHFDLLAYSKASDDRMQGDRALARLSLVEGDASVVMFAWAQLNLTIDELLKAAQEAADPQAAAVLARMPPILRDGSLFPYQSGATFVTALFQSGGWAAVNRAYADPPVSTEQVMHSAKYESREAPVVVPVPEGLAGRMGEGWSIGTQDTLGEFQLQIWLRGSTGAVSSIAANAAAGWGGDRIVLLDGPSGARAVAMLTAWDTAQDATEFADAAGAAVASNGLNALVVFQPGSTTVRVLIGSDDATTGRLHQIFGVSGV